MGTITKVYKHETKQMVETKTYDVFGNLINQTGSSNGNLGFQSKYFDQESGLNYYYHRYYYPTIGRFINEDPIGLSGGLNMYLFVDNDSLNYDDPFGLDKLKDFGEEMRKWFGWYWEREHQYKIKINNIIKLNIDWCKFKECMSGVAADEAKIQNVLSSFNVDYPRRMMVNENPKRYWAKVNPGQYSLKLPEYIIKYTRPYKLANRISMALLAIDIINCLLKSAK